MTTIAVPLVKPVSTPRSVASVLARYYYSAASLLMLGLTLFGFYNFYLFGKAYPSRPLTPPIKSILIAHGLVMTAWILLAVLQPVLVAGRSRRAHMMVGRVGGLVAIAAVVLGVWVATAATRVNPPEMQLFGLHTHAFMVVPLSAIALFTGFVATAIAARKTPAIHKPFMLLATLSVISASIGRIEIFNRPFTNTPFEYHLSAFTPVLLLGALLLAAKSLIDRKLDRWFAIGLAIIAVVTFAGTHLSRTAAWEAFVQWMIR
jgi:hypothetical protein